jgi:hypothetical protein
MKQKIFSAMLNSVSVFPEITGEVKKTGNFKCYRRTKQENMV